MKTKLKRVKLSKEPVLKQKAVWIVQGNKERTIFATTKKANIRKSVEHVLRTTGAKRVHVFKATYNFVEAWESK
jgi:hypothetical protein